MKHSTTRPRSALEYKRFLFALPFALLSIGAAAPAGGPAAAPAPVVRQRLDLPARIVSWKRAMGPKGAAPYTGGAISYDIEVAGPSDKELRSNIIIKNWKLGVDEKVPIVVPPGVHATVRWTEPAGIADACYTFGYNVSLESEPTANKVVDITPNCTFTTEAVDPLAPVPPDTKLAQRANKVSYVSPSFALACVPKAGSSVLEAKMTATAVNKSSNSATNVTLKIDGPKNATAKTLGSLGPNDTKVAEVPWSAVVGGEYALSVTATGAPTFQPGWHVNVGVSCTPEAKLK